jgi:hypothetical protein
LISPTDNLSHFYDRIHVSLPIGLLEVADNCLLFPVTLLNESRHDSSRWEFQHRLWMELYASSTSWFLWEFIADNELECENGAMVSPPAKELMASPVVGIVICQIRVCNEKKQNVIKGVNYSHRWSSFM